MTDTDALSTSAPNHDATAKMETRARGPSKKKRRPVNKCFSGCAKCKALKIKCDETKPHCQRCTKKGFACPGFPTHPNLRWSSKHELQTIRSKERSKKTHEQQTTSPATLAKDKDGIRSDQQDEARDGMSRPTLKSAAQDATTTDPDFLSPGGDGGSSSLTAPNQDDPFAFLSGLWDVSYHQDLSSVFSAPDIGPNQAESCVAHEEEEISQIEPSSYLDIDLDQLPFEDQSSTAVVPNWDSCDNPFPVAIVQESQESIQLSRGCGMNALQPPVHSPSSVSPSGSISSSSPSSSTDDCRRGPDPLSSNPVDFQDKLIHVYFTFVCPRFSTFDSEQNLFRTFVGDKWQHSDAMFYTMLSMAAGKLGDTTADYKKTAVEYQTLALQKLSNNLAAAPNWTSEHLFIILMLGLSACWHDMQDLGIVHLKALHQAILKNTVDMSDIPQAQEFFFDALVYWGMVTGYFTDTSGEGSSSSSAVDFEDIEEARTHMARDRPKYPSLSRVGFPRTEPHPWTSIASAQQRMFTRITNLIKQVRSFDKQGSSDFAPFVSQTTDFLAMLGDLEEELWSLKLPYLHEIANTGDENTPAIHHLLIAEAYMFANMYQLYSVFPNLARKRAYRLSDSEFRTPKSWAEGQVPAWTSALGPHPDYERWLTFLGRNIIVRLEQIQPASGTSCLHPLLLLIGSTALSVHPEHAGTEDEQEVLRTREFVLARMEGFSKQYMSERVRRATSVIREIFKLLDVGVKVLWMDVMQSMGVITVLG